MIHLNELNPRSNEFSYTNTEYNFKLHKFNVKCKSKLVKKQIISFRNVSIADKNKCMSRLNVYIHSLQVGKKFYLIKKIVERTHVKNLSLL